jgi:hypothetical protein
MAQQHHIDTNGTWNYARRKATALDEVKILEEMGREGWELVDLGAYYLEFRRPVDEEKAAKWEYERYGGLNHKGVRRDKLSREWEPAGRWALFLYFKHRMK